MGMEIQEEESHFDVLLARYNCYVAAVLSTINNVLVLVIVILYGNRLRLSTNAVVIAYVSTSAIFYSVNYVLSCPAIHIHQEELLIINNGLMQNIALGRISLCVFAFFILFAELTSAALLAAQYLTVCRLYSISSMKIHTLYGSACLLGFLWTISFANAFWFRHNVFLDNHKHPLKGRPELFSETMSASLVVSLSLLLAISLCSVTCMVFCAQRLILKIKSLRDRKKRHLQSRMLRILQLQAALPFLLLHTPILLSCLIPQTGWFPDTVLDKLVLPTAWYPVFVSFLQLWNLKQRFCQYPPSPATTIRTQIVLTSNNC